VLPVAVGQATRLIEYMDDASKTYLARVRFGVATDTFDADGKVVAASDASALTEADVAAALPEFIGDVEQVPPAYSAIKVAGRPLYRYAREGAAVASASRQVRIDSIELRRFTPGVAEAELLMQCGKGTYVRSLAHDIGQRVGCGAHLVALRRLSSGGFEITDAQSLDDLTRAADQGTIDELLLAPDRAVERRPAVIFDGAHASDVVAGRDVTLPRFGVHQICRAYDITGRFLGVLRPAEMGSWHPVKVLAGA
jgi:tRNA pseudouridine55 synthase